MCNRRGNRVCVNVCVVCSQFPKRGLVLIHVDGGAAGRMEKTSWSRTWAIRPAVRDLGLIIHYLLGFLFGLGVVRARVHRAHVSCV